MPTNTNSQSAWVLTFAVLGTYCATIAYVLPGDAISKNAMFTIATTLIGGALGAFVTRNANLPPNPPKQPTSSTE
jgi:hypothetical protein